jgi:hypothetical protein
MRTIGTTIEQASADIGTASFCRRRSEHVQARSGDVCRRRRRALDLKPEELMLVASHKYDLRAAARYSLRRGFIERPHEYGRKKNRDLAPKPS